MFKLERECLCFSQGNAAHLSYCPQATSSGKSKDITSHLQSGSPVSSTNQAKNTFLSEN